MTVSALGERSPGVPGVERLRRFGAGVADRVSRSLATIGRSARLALEMIRFAITDTFTLRLAGGEVIDQMWKLFKVTALPALLMSTLR